MLAPLLRRAAEDTSQPTSRRMDLVAAQLAVGMTDEALATLRRIKESLHLPGVSLRGARLAVDVAESGQVTLAMRILGTMSKGPKRIIEVEHVRAALAMGYAGVAERGFRHGKTRLADKALSQALALAEGLRLPDQVYLEAVRALLQAGRSTEAIGLCKRMTWTKAAAAQLIIEHIISAKPQENVDEILDGIGLAEPAQRRGVLASALTLQLEKLLATESDNTAKKSTDVASRLLTVLQRHLATGAASQQQWVAKGLAALIRAGYAKQCARLIESTGPVGSTWLRVMVARSLLGLSPVESI